MELRQDGENDIPLTQWQRAPEGQVVPEAVGVGEDDALGRSFAPRREHDQQRVIVADRAGWPRVARRGDGALNAGSPQGGNQRRLRQFTDGVGRGRGELVIDHQQLGVAAAERVDELTRALTPRERNERDTDKRASEEEHDVVDGVSRERCDARSRAEARSCEALGEFSRPVGQLAVGDRHPAIVDRNTMRCVRGALDQPPADRVRLVLYVVAHARTSEAPTASASASASSMLRRLSRT